MKSHKDMISNLNVTFLWWDLQLLFNKGYPSEAHLKPKSLDIWFYHNLFINYPIVSKFSTEHGSNTAVLCAKFQNDDWITETDVMEERDFARFEFKMSFGRISYIAHPLVGRINARSQTDWTIEDGAKNVNSIARTLGEWAFSPLDATAQLHHPWLWGMHIPVVISILHIP